MSHLSFEERYEIAEGLEAGLSIHKIAKKLGRSDSSIAREKKRNRISVRTDRVIACTKEITLEWLLVFRNKLRFFLCFQ